MTGGAVGSLFAQLLRQTADERKVLLVAGALFPATGSSHVAYSTYVLCVVSGIVAGVLAFLATVAVYAAEDFLRRLPIHWMW
jgi:H+/Cl- antiporter ClcA